METWLLVAAEERELRGLLRRAIRVTPLNWGNVKFAREIEWRQRRGLLVANGAGPAAVKRALEDRPQVDRMISVGFAGALDPALRIGDIVVSGETLGAKSEASSDQGYVRGKVLSIDRVAATAEEKRTLRQRTGAAVVEMESAAVACQAAQWEIPFSCIRVVSDVAEEDLPLDFNLYRKRDGDFSKTRIAAAAMIHPFAVMPGLLRLNDNCRIAAESLGEFLANL